MLLAGGGFKGGIAYGRTDDFGFESVENRVHINDLHATGAISALLTWAAMSAANVVRDLLA